MRVVVAAAIVTSLIAPALAQQEHVRGYREADPDKSQTQKAADKAAADAYKQSLSAIPDKGPTDPWGDARATEAPKPGATKTAKSKVKTGNTKTGNTEGKPQ
jgi:hypothetical protein